MKLDQVCRYLLLLLANLILIPPVAFSFNNTYNLQSATSQDDVAECEAFVSQINSQGKLNVCKDGRADLIRFNHNGNISNTVFYSFLLTDTLGNILSEIDEESFDFDLLPELKYKVYGVSYQSPTPSFMGFSIDQIAARECFILSLNHINVSVERLRGTIELLSDYNGSPISCKGASDGKLQVVPMNGTPPYRFQWQDGRQGPNQDNLIAGNYTVLFSDNEGCRTVLRYNLTEPDSIQTNVQTKEPLCQGDEDGFIKVELSGGIPPYRYSWTNGNNTDSIGGLGLGNYLCVAEDVNGCLAKVSRQFEVQSDLDINVQTEDIKCFGEENGVGMIEFSGGIGPVSFLWDDGSTDVINMNLGKGPHVVSVSDSLGCLKTQNFTIEEPDSLQIILESQPDNGSGTGSVQVIAQGGTPPYKYTWGQTATDSLAALRNLSYGTYIVHVMDDNGCEMTGQIQVENMGEDDCGIIHHGFTPNGDGINEYFYLPCAESFPENELVILNRWGQELLRTVNYKNDWNGEISNNPLPDGTYYYILQVEDVPIRRTYKGTISIIR